MAARHRELTLGGDLGLAHVIEAGKGPAVVLLNGIGTPAAMWAPLMARLPGHRLLAVDLPGYGTSRAGGALPGDVRRGAVAFLRATLAALELDRPTVVANSLGSLWSLWAELDAPGTFARAVHVGCPALVLGTSAPLPMRLLGTRPVGPVLARLDPPSRRGVRRIARMVHQDPLPDDIARLLLATQRLPAFRDTFLGTLNALVGLRGARPGRGLGADELARVRTRTLLVFGAQDPMGSADAGRRMAAAMPDARLVVVPGGHAPWLNAPEEIGRCVRDFLADSGGSCRMNRA